MRMSRKETSTPAEWLPFQELRVIDPVGQQNVGRSRIRKATLRELEIFAE
jgi:hypothetical protein